MIDPLLTNPYRQMIGRLTMRQFQAMQTRMERHNEAERMAFLYRQLEVEIELDENEDNLCT